MGVCGGCEGCGVVCYWLWWVGGGLCGGCEGMGVVVRVIFKVEEVLCVNCLVVFFVCVDDGRMVCF